MNNLTKETEHYIEHEVQIRLHDEKFKHIDKSIDELKDSIRHLDNKFIAELKDSIRHLDNKFMLMFTVILGSIWLPAILKYLHVV